MKHGSSSGLKTVIGTLVTAVLALGCAGYPASGSIGSSKKAIQLVELDIAGPDSLNVGDVQQYTATGVFDDGTQVDLTLGVVWTSSDQTVATVNPFEFAGQVTAIGAGQVTITAQGDDGVSGSIIITVVDPNAPVDPSNGGGDSGAQSILP